MNNIRARESMIVGAWEEDGEVLVGNEADRKIASKVVEKFEQV